MDNLILAKLITIEKLLTVIASDRRFGELLREVGDEMHRDYGARLNELFPSDPEYEALDAIYSNFRDALQTIELNVANGGRVGEASS
jgi:hypothetical protein